MHVVFTGPAVNPDGTAVIREDLVKACTGKGITVQSGVTPRTQMLVASRMDTVKARKALDIGIVVMSYQSFIKKHLDGYVAPCGGTPHPVVDQNLPPMGIAFGDEL